MKTAVYVISFVGMLLSSADAQQRCVNGRCDLPVASYPQQYTGRPIAQPTLPQPQQGKRYRQVSIADLTKLFARVETLEAKVAELSKR